MSSGRPSTIYCQQVVRMLVDAGERVRRDIAAYSRDLAQDQDYYDSYWRGAEGHFCEAIKRHLGGNQARAVRLITDVTGVVTADAVEKYLGLMDRLINEGSLYPVCRYAKKDPDFCYAMATFLLLYTHNSRSQCGLEKAVRQMTGTRFVLGRNRRDWNKEIAREMFGTAWLALYEPDLASSAGVIEQVLHQRPPILGHDARVQDVYLDGDMAAGL